MEKTQLVALYSFTVYTCHAYGRCLTLPEQRTWRLPIGSRRSDRTFVVFRCGRIWLPKQNARLNDQNSLQESFRPQELNILNEIVLLRNDFVLSPLLFKSIAREVVFHTHYPKSSCVFCIPGNRVARSTH